ncbi:MAG: glycosyltransferase family 2 protein [Planctomycetota bacterium]|jgi:GT2 family glycosyltransferase
MSTTAAIEHVPEEFTGPPVVSVIIPNYEGENYLPACFRALAGQVFRRFEVVVVDNGSKDESRAVVRRLAPSMPFMLKYIDLGTNRGFSYAVNRGIEHSSGEFVALLNNDTECDREWLSALVNEMTERPETGFLASNILLKSSPGNYDCTGHCITTAGIGEVHNRWQPVRENERSRGVFGACAAASMYRREALLEVGPLDESYFMYYEDLDLDMRLRMAGFSCRYVPEAVVYHRLGAAARGLAGTRRTFLLSRNMESFFFAYFPGPFRWRHFINHTALVFLQMLEHFLRGGGGAYLKGKLAFFRNIRRVRDKRRRVLSRFGNGREIRRHYAGSWLRRYLSSKLTQRRYRAVSGSTTSTRSRRLPAVN